MVVTAHLGRPKGAPDPAYTLAPVADRLGELLGADVAFATDTVGESAHETVSALEDGQVAVLENVRFNEGETSKDDAVRASFAGQLSQLADAFVSDGFGVVHRKQASVYDVALRLPAGDGGPGGHRGRGAAPAHPRSRAALRRRAGRLEGLRQARRHRQPARQGRPAADRRRHGVHVPEGAGARGRQEPPRGRPARHLPRLPAPRRGVRGRDRAADRHRRRHRVPVRRPRARAAGRRRRRDPGRRPRARHRARLGRRVRRGASPAPAPCSGTARWACSRPTPSPAARAPSPRR